MDLVEVTGSTIASRFQTQDVIDANNAQRDAEWKAAYERLGQAPPKQEEVVHDGRTLYERLESQKNSKTEEWDAKMKLSNQYRGVDAEEFRFLSETAAVRAAEEKKRRDEENAEVNEYRAALAAKNVVTVTDDSPPPAQAKRIPPKAIKKDVKSLLKGVVVKKKPKPGEKITVGSSNASPLKSGEKRRADEAVDTGEDGKKSKAE